MSDDDDHPSEYTEQFVAGLEFMWGEGFLSPGGPAEVASILDGHSLAGKRVLDLGCGLGGVDVLLVRTHGAMQVVGVDIEPALVDRAARLALRAGVAERVVFHCVAPGPLPFDPASFDVVFSKDAIIHVPDKGALYRDLGRVLVPGGLLIGSDWLRGGTGPPGAALAAWLAAVGLSFEMGTLETTRAALEAAGFEAVCLRDRQAWYQEEVAREVARVAAAGRAELVAQLGEAAAEARLASNALRAEAVRAGELRPTHFSGRRR